VVEVISSLTIIFVASALTLFISNKLSQPAIPAYIAAGIATGFLVDQSELLTLVELGIAFLVFIFGLKFDPGKLNSLRTDALITNSLQLVLVGVLSFSFGSVIGLGSIQAFYFSIVATLSSTLVGLELIEKEVDKNIIHGRLSESINLIQDLFAVLAVILIGAFISNPSNWLETLTAGIGIIVLGILVRGFLIDTIAEQAEGSRELLMLTSLTFLTAFIGLSQYFELSIVVGSFSAGIAVAKFPHNLEILETMGSIKDFFSAIFFVTLGALVSIPSLETILLTAGIIFFTLLIKPGLFTTSLLHQGYDSRTSFLTSLSLDQVSEFALIITIQGYLAGIIGESLFQATVLAATLTMITSSYTKLYEHKIYEKIKGYNILDNPENNLPKTNFDEELEDHIIILGYDIQGKKISQRLSEIDQKFVIIENDPEKVTESKENGENTIYGNALSSETWEKAGFKDAKLIISTAPFNYVSERVLELETSADKIVASEEIEKAEDMIKKGATYVIVPEILASDLITEHILGLQNEENYEEELRRKNLLEVKKYLNSDEG